MVPKSSAGGGMSSKPEVGPGSRISVTGSIFQCNSTLRVLTSPVPHPTELLSVSGTFLGYSALCLLSAFFVFFAVPETRGKSLHEISEDLSKK